MIAAGVALFLVDLARNFRFAIDGQRRQRLERRHARVAAERHVLRRAAFRSVTSREPLWDQPEPRRRGRGRPLLPARRADRRARDARHEPARRAAAVPAAACPGPSWPPFVAALFTAAFFLLLTVKLDAARDRVRRRRGRDDRCAGCGRPIRGPIACAGRHRRRHQAAGLRDAARVAFVVGDGRADARRRVAVRRARLLLSLPLDRVAAGRGRRRTRCPRRAIRWLAAGCLALASSAAIAREPRARRAVDAPRHRGRAAASLIALCAAFARRRSTRGASRRSRRGNRATARSCTVIVASQGVLRRWSSC